MIIGENITKVFEDYIALKNVSISLEPGKITALIGPSGSGKSTLLRALSLLDLPDSGTVKINQTTYNFPLKEHEELIPPWPNVSVVFQQLFLWPHLSLRNNILLPLKIINKTNNNDIIEELIKIFDMHDFIDRYPNETSLGQRQRAALARAFALEPNFILLDEVTSALDVEYISKLLNYLEAQSNKGVGILLITHLIGFAQRGANQVVFLDKGEVIESGPAKEIIASPKSKRLKEFLSVLASVN